MQNLTISSTRKRDKQAGLALGEYVMVASLVLCVCVLGFMTVGANLKSYFLGLKGEMQQHNKQTQLAKVAVAKNIAAIEEKKAVEEAKLQALGGSLKVDPSNPNALCSSNWCIDAPGLTGDYVYTAGSNGDRSKSPANVAANIYAQVAKILEEQGSADPAMITVLTDMANRGHGLADSAYQLTSSNDYYGMKAGADGLQKNLQEFKQMSQQLNGSLAQFPPDVRAILSDASRVVIGVGDSFDLDFTPRNGNSRIGYVRHSVKISLVHSKSNNICENGGDQTQCMR